MKYRYLKESLWDDTEIDDDELEKSHEETIKTLVNNSLYYFASQTVEKLISSQVMSQENVRCHTVGNDIFLNNVCIDYVSDNKLTYEENLVNLIIQYYNDILSYSNLVQLCFTPLKFNNMLTYQDQIDYIDIFLKIVFDNMPEYIKNKFHSYNELPFNFVLETDFIIYANQNIVQYKNTSSYGDLIIDNNLKNKLFYNFKNCKFVYRNISTYAEDALARHILNDENIHPISLKYIFNLSKETDIINMFNSIYDKTLNNINSVKDNIADLTDVIRNLNKPNKLIILMFSFELFKQHMDYDSYLDLLKSFPFAIEYIAKTVYNDYGNSIIVYIHLGDCMLSIRKKVKIPDEESLNILKSHSKQIKNQIIAIAKNYSNLAINFLSSISDQIVY